MPLTSSFQIDYSDLSSKMITRRQAFEDKNVRKKGKKGEVAKNQLYFKKYLRLIIYQSIDQSINQ